MLKPAQHHKPLVLLALLIAVLTAPFLGATPALAGGKFDCEGPTCTTVITDPGNGGGGRDNGKGAVSEGTTDFTPGPKTCKLHGKDIPCTKNGSAWDNAEGCYWDVKDPQPDPPPGASDTGACYTQDSTPPWLATA